MKKAGNKEPTEEKGGMKAAEAAGEKVGQRNRHKSRDKKRTEEADTKRIEKPAQSGGSSQRKTDPTKPVREPAEKKKTAIGR